MRGAAFPYLAVAGVQRPVGDAAQQRERIHFQQGKPLAPVFLDRVHRRAFRR